ncbi:MAG: YrdB family protein [Clostridiales bacterium]|nr:YrdB family protein [Clostridiales bacterium]
MTPFEWILGGLAFAVEIALWLGSGRIVFLLLKDKNHGLAVAAGILTVVAFIALWAVFLAPKADHRLPEVPRVLLIALFSLGIGLGLYALGMKTPGLVLAIAGTVILVLGQLLVVH